jgi:nucleotide-binding universal stress UspA family protein
MALTMRRILFPTDLSEASDSAARAAVALARQYGADLTMLYVVPPVTDPSPAERLGARAAELAPGLAVKTEVLSGIPARKIAEYARRHRIDLIVVGSHGRTGVSRALLGSVAEAVVRRSPCPVLVVPATAGTSLVEAEPAEEALRCIVCLGITVDLVCDSCRRRIRGGALGREPLHERPGR